MDNRLRDPKLARNSEINITKLVFKFLNLIIAHRWRIKAAIRKIN